MIDSLTELVVPKGRAVSQRFGVPPLLCPWRIDRLREALQRLLPTPISPQTKSFNLFFMVPCVSSGFCTAATRCVVEHMLYL